MKKFDIVFGSGYGVNELDAFDEALCNAGIGDFNLVKVSSIVPEACIKSDFPIAKKLMPKGSILYIAYSVAYIKPEDKADLAVAGIGIGLSSEYGVIMECHGEDKIEVLSKLESLIIHAFNRRNIELRERLYKTCEVKKEKDTFGCAFVGVPIWE